jgi:hypothetical protein
MKRLAALLLVPVVLTACSDGPIPVEPQSDGAALFANGQTRSSICHRNGTGSYNAIEVAAPSLPAHMAHGDGTPGSALADHSGAFNAACGLTRITLDASTTMYTGLGGGGGGGPFDDACPAGSVAVGLSGDRANYFGHAVIWSHRVECRELRGDGTLGASSSTPSRGPIFGSPPIAPYTAFCASDGLLTGINGDNHSLVNSIAGSCADVGTVLASGAPTSSIGPFVGFGFGFLATYSLQCPSGFAATGTFGSSGDVLDSVGLRCTKVVVVTS